MYIKKVNWVKIQKEKEIINELSSNLLNNLDIWNEKQKNDVIQAKENKNENNKEILYIIEWVVYNKNTLTKEEIKNLENDESNFAKTIWEKYIIFDTDKDTAVYMMKYLIKWIFGSRELDSIKLWHIFHFITIFLIFCLVFLIAFKPSTKDFEKIIKENKLIITNSNNSNNSNKIEQKSFSWEIIKINK